MRPIHLLFFKDFWCLKESNVLSLLTVVWYLRMSVESTTTRIDDREFQDIPLIRLSLDKQLTEPQRNIFFWTHDNWWSSIAVWQNRCFSYLFLRRFE